MDILRALEILRPFAEFVGNPDTRGGFEAMRWLDSRPKPTWEELCAVEVPPPVPEEVTRVQFTLALRGRKIYETVRGAAELHSQELIDFFDYATSFTRHSEYLALLCGLLDIDNETMDQIFIEADGFLAS